jgi:hypothetical protein
LLTAAFFNFNDDPKTLVHVERAFNGTMIRFSTKGGSDIEVVIADSTLKDLSAKLLQSEVIRPLIEKAVAGTLRTIDSIKRLNQPAKAKK